MTEPGSISTPYVVKRTIRLTGLSGDQALAALVAELSAQPGMIDVKANARRQRLQLHYDVKQFLFDDIVQFLSVHDVALAPQWWMRCKASWYRLLDDNARANANARGGACCSNPTGIYAQRHKRG